MKIFTYIISGLLVAVLLVMVVLAFKVYDPNDLKGSIPSLAGISTCIVAALSAWLSVLTLQSTRETHYQDQKIGIFHRWYDNLVIKPHLADVQAFFTFCETDMSKAVVEVNIQAEKLTGEQYDKAMQERVMTPFTDKFTDLRRDLVTDISIINQKLSEKVSEEFDEFQDSFTAILEKRNIKQEEVIACAKQSYKEIMTLLRDFEDCQ